MEIFALDKVLDTKMFLFQSSRCCAAVSYCLRSSLFCRGGGEFPFDMLRIFILWIFIYFWTGTLLFSFWIRGKNRL